MATSFAPKVFKNFINGDWVPARSGSAIEDRNPADTAQLIGLFPASSEEDVGDAIDAAKAAREKVASHAGAEARARFCSAQPKFSLSARKTTRLR